jgi:hypothetical protein
MFKDAMLHENPMASGREFYHVHRPERSVDRAVRNVVKPVTRRRPPAQACFARCSHCSLFFADLLLIFYRSFADCDHSTWLLDPEKQTT